MEAVTDEVGDDDLDALETAPQDKPNQSTPPHESDRAFRQVAIPVRALQIHAHLHARVWGFRRCTDLPDHVQLHLSSDRMGKGAQDSHSEHLTGEDKPFCCVALN